MKNKQFLLVSMLLLLVFGCSDNQGGSGGSTNTKWRTGTDGIIMSFAQDSPPSEVVSTQQVNVIVEYSNKGAFDVDNLVFYLSGYDNTIFSFGRPVMEERAPRITGKSQFYPEGSQLGFINWRAEVNTPQTADSFTQDLTVTSCYSYQTIANPSICIDPKKYDYVVAGRCKFDVSDLGSSQGGPIAVTSIKQKTTNNRVYLEIYFENKGSGVPFSPSIGVTNCYNSITLNDKDTVRVSQVYLPGGRSFTCNPNTNIRLTNNRGFVICELPISGESYYVTALTVVIDYNYRQSMTKSLKVVNVG